MALTAGSREACSGHGSWTTSKQYVGSTTHMHTNKCIYMHTHMCVYIYIFNPVNPE